MSTTVDQRLVQDARKLISTTLGNAVAMNDGLLGTTVAVGDRHAKPVDRPRRGLADVDGSANDAAEEHIQDNAVVGLLLAVVVLEGAPPARGACGQSRLGTCRSKSCSTRSAAVADLTGTFLTPAGRGAQLTMAPSL
jgi:hypothetical protein